MYKLCNNLIFMSELCISHFVATIRLRRVCFCGKGIIINAIHIFAQTRN